MNNDLLSDVAKVAQFQQLTERFKRVEGWLNPIEGTTYHRFTENLEGRGLFDYVEPIIADRQRWQPVMRADKTQTICKIA